ncbi:MAG: hypothetical protein R3236_04170, partial [Phycisphaeraceae bacterium]|nr:hypothetical protein [Phycisphaeraceae bacterium]
RPSAEVFWQHNDHTVVMIRLNPQVNIEPLIREYMQLYPSAWPPADYAFSQEAWARDRVEMAMARMRELLKRPRPVPNYSNTFKNKVFNWRNGVHCELREISRWFDTPYSEGKAIVLGDHDFPDIVETMAAWWKKNPAMRQQAPVLDRGPLLRQVPD